MPTEIIGRAWPRVRHPQPSEQGERGLGIQRKTRRRRNVEPSAILMLDPRTASQAHPFEDDGRVRTVRIMERDNVFRQLSLNAPRS